MLERLSPTRRNWLLGLIGVLLLVFAWSVRWVLNPFIAAYFLAYVLHPLVMRLQRFGWSRGRAVNTIFLTAALLGTLVTVGIGFQTAGYSREIATPEWRELQVGKINSFLDRNSETVSDVLNLAGFEVTPGETLDIGGLFSDMHAELAPEPETDAVGTEPWEPPPLLRLLASLTGSIATFFAFVLLLPVYTYFLLFELEKIHAWVRRYLPRKERARISRVGGQIGEVISSFFRGRLTVCLFKGLAISLGLAILGVKYPLMLGMSAGLLSLIPFAGPFLAFSVAFMLALQQKELELLGAFWRTALVYGIAELLEGYFLVPKILGDKLGMHPVAVLLSVFVGAAAFGTFGVLIALPVAAASMILVREFVLPALARFAEES